MRCAGGRGDGVAAGVAVDTASGKVAGGRRGGSMGSSWAKGSLVDTAVWLVDIGPMRGRSILMGGLWGQRRLVRLFLGRRDGKGPMTLCDVGSFCEGLRGGCGWLT